MPEINRGELAAHYGFALAFMNSNPELKALFDKAVKKTWNTDRFIAELRGTDWFKNHSASVRNAIMQETSDPATYQANVAQMQATVKDAWGAAFGTEVPAQQLKAWAETAYRMGWTEAQLMDRMTEGVNWRKMLQNKTLGGKAAETESQLNNLASNYGLRVTQQWKARQLERVIEGTNTIGGVQQQVQEMAMSRYKAFADRIAGGETVRDIAEPYVSTMADLLEMNPEDVDFTRGLVDAALRARTKDGKPAAMDLNTFADHVRRDKRWQYTDNAREEVSSTMEGLLRSFGLMA